MVTRAVVLLNNRGGSRAEGNNDGAGAIAGAARVDSQQLLQTKRAIAP
jgi:hypothetical protein